jgi:ABC-2 type transport system permease protein
MHATLHKLTAAVAKEMRILLRDREALLILFVMPVTFVLIMSLALQDAFSERAGIRFPLLIVDHDHGVIGDRLIQHFGGDNAFNVTSLRAAEGGGKLPDAARVQEDLRSGHYKFAIIVPTGASRDAGRHMDQQLGLAQAGKTPAARVDIRLLADPTVRRDHRGLVISGLNRVLQGIESGMLLARYSQVTQQVRAMGGPPGATSRKAAKTLTTFSNVTDAADSTVGTRAPTPVPTSVQQNAPAWTLLAMFFLVIPLSVALIKERQQGSLTRLQSMAVPPWVLLAGKTLPYFLINQIQVVLILLVGMYLLPRLGGDALHIGHAPGAIALLSMAASLAAIGYGLLVATFARTPEQATTFGATSVLIFAALGGVMVPKLVMPPMLQQISNISPLSWGLEGFLDIFVRAGGVREVLPEFLQLLAFAAACMAIAVLRFSHGLRHN